MDLIITAIVFVLIFSALVLIHEWGHFAAARKSGIKVEEFGFGLPPRIWGKKKGETLYSLNAIPFGGFVRLLGEDSRDPKALKDKRSFISKKPRTRLFVLTAGVVMNYLLALVLLTIGFTFGIQPLIVDGDDFYANVQNGTLQLESGIIVDSVEEDGVADHAGLLSGDNILTVNSSEVSGPEEMAALIADPGQDLVYLNVERDGQFLTIQLEPREGDALGFSPHQMVFLPKVVVREVEPESVSANAGLRTDDLILSMNGQDIYSMEDYEFALRSSSEISYRVQRRGDEHTVNAIYPAGELVIINSIFPGTPADTAGIKRGDVVVEVNELNVTTPQDVIEFSAEAGENGSIYVLRRGDQLLTKTIKPEESGLIGIGISSINSYKNKDVSVYTASLPSSVVEIRDIKVPFWEAPFKAIEETGRLAVLTFDMFGEVIVSAVTELAVPEGVAGPVGIASLTYQFVQQGLLSVLRFMALLSLSLAILNIFPFPALDGGRVFFVLAEIVMGRRIGQKAEAIIHATGFVILLLLIGLVTFNDILRLF